MRRDLARLVALANLILLFVAVRPLSAATFTWIKNSGGNGSGSWTNQANWSGATLATTTSDAVNFNTLDITADSTVTLDGNQSANVLNFGDTNTSTAGSWIINAGSPSSSTLTLGGASPTINVTSLGGGKAAAINAIITGTAGFTKTGTSFLQLNGVNTYSGGTILSGSDCRTSIGNDLALGTELVTVGGTVGDGQNWFNAAGSRTLTNAFEIRTIRWIIDNTAVNGVAAGNLTLGGNVLINTGSSNVRDIYCSMNLTINGNVSVTPTNNPMNKNGGYTLTLNGTNTVGGASAVNGGTLIVNGPMNGGATFTVNSGSALGGTGVFSGPIVVANGGNLVAGNSSGGTLTCRGLTANATSQLSLALGATNNPANSMFVVNGNLTLAGTLSLSDLGFSSAGAYTNFYYSGTLVNNGLTVMGGPLGNTAVVDTSIPHYVLLRILAGQLSPGAGDGVPMDSVSPLTLTWVQVLGAANYEVYFGTVSNAVAAAETNTAGIYLGRTNALALNVANLQPNTTYY
jgi:hypothetical protein